MSRERTDREMSNPHARSEERTRRETQAEKRRGTSEETILSRIQTHGERNHKAEGKSSPGIFLVFCALEFLYNLTLTKH